MDAEPPTYQEFSPGAALSDHVACLWRYTGPGDETPQPIVPDGRPEFIVHLAAPYLELPERVRQPQFLFAGQLTRPLNLVADNPVDVIGVRFRADGASDFLRAAMDTATDRRLAWRAIEERGSEVLAGDLTAARSNEAQLDVVRLYVERRIDGRSPDLLVRTVVDAIMAGASWEIPTGVGMRQFQRRFRQAVGVSARQLQALRRFRSVFDRFEQEEALDWCRRALDAGYFDQPQLARDFRRFLGCTARQWIRQTPGLARALGAPTS